MASGGKSDRNCQSAVEFRLSFRSGSQLPTKDNDQKTTLIPNKSNFLSHWLNSEIPWSSDFSVMASHQEAVLPYCKSAKKMQIIYSMQVKWQHNIQYNKKFILQYIETCWGILAFGRAMTFEHIIPLLLVFVQLCILWKITGGMSFHSLSHRIRPHFGRWRWTRGTNCEFELITSSSSRSQGHFYQGTMC